MFPCPSLLLIDRVRQWGWGRLFDRETAVTRKQKSVLDRFKLNFNAYLKPISKQMARPQKSGSVSKTKTYGLKRSPFPKVLMVGGGGGILVNREMKTLGFEELEVGAVFTSQVVIKDFAGLLPQQVVVVTWEKKQVVAQTIVSMKLSLHQ